MGGKSAVETLTIERMRLAVASAAGEVRAASDAFGKIEASGGLSGVDKMRAIESLAIGAYRARDYAAARQWAQRYVKDGGDSAAIRRRLTGTPLARPWAATLAMSLMPGPGRTTRLNFTARF